MKAITAVAKILKREGVEYVSCFPYNPLIDAAAQEGIRVILTRSERVAVNIADGYTRVSNRRVGMVCAVQADAGIQNSFAGVAQAFSDSVPILVLPQGNVRHKMSLPPNFEAVPPYREVTKWAAQINCADRVPEMLRRAFTCLRMGKPGPVLLEIPTDVANEECDEAAFRYTPVKTSRPAADPQDIREAAKVLLRAKNPLIHAGQGVLYAGASTELQELAELLHIPVLTTLSGKSAFPEDHPLALGIYANTETKAAAHFLRKADVIFGVGCSFGRTLLAAPLPPGKVIIHLTIDERDVNIDHAADVVLMGDAKLALRQLIEEIKAQAGPSIPRNDVAGEIQAIKEEWLKEWMPKLTSDEVPINPYRVVWELMRGIDARRSIVIHDAGYPRDHLAPFYVAPTPRSYISWGHSTQLGTSLGLAMGAKLAAPDKLVINVMGDGAFGMVGTDFETAVRERIPILTILINNSALGGYEVYIPIAAQRYGTKFLSGDYAKVAEALGGYSEKVVQPAELTPALQRAKRVVEAGRPALLEVITREELARSKYS